MKQRLMRGCVVALLCTGAVLCPAKEQESLADLKARAEAAKLPDQPHLYMDVAERQLETATQKFNAGDTDTALASVQDIVTYSAKAEDAAVKSGKHLKQTEISLRKIVVKLRDLKRAVSFEDREPLQAAIDNLEKLRTELLTKMFAKD
jgi:HEPN domain-containing protein